MMIRIATFAVTALLSAATALAQDAAPAPPFNPDAYPPEVRRALRYGHEECLRAGGGKVTFAPDTVRQVDLTGDGRDDYIVDFHHTACAGWESTYCGTGGCTMEILVTLPDGKVRSVFNGRAHDIEISPDPVVKSARPRTIRFALHGSYCGGFGSQVCNKTHRITAKPFAFRQ